MNILFLMGGDKLQTNNDNFPIYMAEINQKMILEILIDFTKSVNPIRAIFCIKNEDIKNFYLDEIIKRRIEDAIIININGETKGAVCTSMLASEFIDSDDELLIVAINDFTDKNWQTIIDYFRDGNFDCGIVSFNSIHPRYSFAKLYKNLEYDKLYYGNYILLDIDNFMSNYKRLFLYDMIFPLNKLEFENNFYPVPNNYKSYIYRQ